MIKAYNCAICAEEYSIDELNTTTLASINTTIFKICQKCIDISDPAEDYRQVREIVSNYLKISNAKKYR